MSKDLDQILNEHLGEEAKELFQEAYNVKLSEAREELAVQLREEFAQKHEHDKQLMIEAMDNFLNDRIEKEIQGLMEDKKALQEEKNKCKEVLKENIDKFSNFIAEQLAKEVKELHADRKKLSEGFAKMEGFVMKQLAEEIQELRNDKKALVEQRVIMVAEGKRKIEETKAAFIKRSAEICEKNLNAIIKKEIEQFRDDIKVARENDFGRRIFESFAGEYMASHLNESSKMKELTAKIEEMNSIVESSKKQAEESKAVLEGYKTKLNEANEKFKRNQIMNEIMAPLSREKRTVMAELLSSVHTDKLKESFNKYLPTVLNENKKPVSNTVLNETKLSEKTGDRVNPLAQHDVSAELKNIKRLAGL